MTGSKSMLDPEGLQRDNSEYKHLSSLGVSKRSKDDNEKMSVLRDRLNLALHQFIRQEESRLLSQTKLPGLDKFERDITRDFSTLIKEISDKFVDIKDFNDLGSVLVLCLKISGRAFSTAAELRSWDSRLDRAYKMIHAKVADTFYSFPATDVDAAMKSRSKIPGYRYAISGALTMANTLIDLLVYTKEVSSALRSCLEGEVKLGSPL